MKFKVQCGFCGELFDLDHKDMPGSKHGNTIALLDQDINEKYYIRKTVLACPKCVDRIMNASMEAEEVGE